MSQVFNSSTVGRATLVLAELRGRYCWGAGQVWGHEEWLARVNGLLPLNPRYCHEPHPGPTPPFFSFFAHFLSPHSPFFSQPTIVYGGLFYPYLVKSNWSDPEILQIKKLWLRTLKICSLMIPRQKCHRLNNDVVFNMIFLLMNLILIVRLELYDIETFQKQWLYDIKVQMKSIRPMMQCWKRGDFVRIRISKMPFNILCRCRSKQNPTWNISRQWRFGTVFPLNGEGGNVPQFVRVNPNQQSSDECYNKRDNNSHNRYLLI